MVDMTRKIECADDAEMVNFGRSPMLPTHPDTPTAVHHNHPATVGTDPRRDAGTRGNVTYM